MSGIELTDEERATLINMLTTEIEASRLIHIKVSEIGLLHVEPDRWVDMQQATIARAAAFATFVLLSACVGSISTTDAGPSPTNYKADLAEYIRSNFFDPYSIRDIAVSEPFPMKIRTYSGWVVCLQTNAKNRMGGYAGRQMSAHMFQGDKILDIAIAPDLICRNVPLHPWPEMESHG